MGQGAGIRRPRAGTDQDAAAGTLSSDSYDHARGDGASKELAGSVRIRCNNCGHVSAVPFGTVNINCENCGSKVWIALAHVAQQAAIQVDTHVRRSLKELEASLEEQAGLCRRQWDDLSEEMQLTEALWDSQVSAAAEGAAVAEAETDADGPSEAAVASGPSSEEAATARAVVQEAFEAQDAAQLEEALALASAAGLNEPPESFSKALKLLRQQEDLEGVWRCIKRALEERDRVDLQLWCDEAETQGLVVPDSVLLTLRALQSEEHARLAELQYQASVNRRATEAHRAGDAQALRDLAKEAKALGADPSPAAAALSALHMGIEAPADAPSAAPPPAVASASSADDHTRGVEASEGDAGAAASGTAPCHESPEQEPAKAQNEPATASKETSASKEPAGGPSTEDCAPAASPSPPNTAGHDPEIAEKVRGFSVSQLKAELAARGLGVDLTGAREKEELVWMLIAAWGMPKIGAATRTGSGPSKGPAPPPPQQPGEGGRGGDDAEGGHGNSQPRRSQQGPPGGYNQHPGAAPKGGPRVPPPPPPGGGAYGSRRAPPAAASAPGAMTRGQALACLGLSGNPSAEELRKAYKKAALRWHPDRRQNHDRADEAKARFQNVRAAFDLLQAEL